MERFIIQKESKQRLQQLMPQIKSKLNIIKAKGDYKMEKELYLKKLEDVKVTFGKHAFATKIMYCDRCNIKMKKVKMDVFVSEEVRARLNIFRCPKCKEEMLGFDEAKRLDRALVIGRLLSKDYSFGFKRKLSFDGANYIFRLPTELTRGKHTEVSILPIESDEALIRW